MPQFVASNVVREATWRRRTAVHDSLPQPGFLAEAAKQGERCRANRQVVSDQATHRQGAETGAGHILLLVETGQLPAIAAGQTERAIGKDPLIIGKMAQNLFDGPLPLAVRKITTQVSELFEKSPRCYCQVLQNLARVVSIDTFDVGVGVLRILAPRRTAVRQG